MTKRLSKGYFLFAIGIVMVFGFELPNLVVIGNVVGYTHLPGYSYVQIVGIILGFIIMGIGWYMKNKE